MLCRQTKRCLTVLAPAKLNLFLRIVSRRLDGFHDIESVMAAINFYDTLTFEPSSSGQIDLRIVNALSRSTAGVIGFEAPAGPENLVIRAATLLRQHAGCELGAQISLVKRIPSSAGLGGGSSDCAATLIALNRLWKLNLRREKLVELAGHLGSDVAFFLADSPLAICTGRGERVESLQIFTPLHFVIAKPASGLSTPAVYKYCTPDSGGKHVGEFVQMLRTGDHSKMARRLHNGLQQPAESLSADVRQLRNLFERLPVIGHQMSGSGSSYFGICSSRRHALGVASCLRSAGIPWVQVVRTCP